MILAMAFVELTPSGSSALPTGCAADRPAVAYHSDGTSAAAPDGLVPCAVHTGYGGTEMHIRVAPNGEVVAQPADVPTGRPSHFEGGLASSRDEGSSWQLVAPGGKIDWWPHDAAIHIDRVTGRLLYVNASAVHVELVGLTGLLSSPASPAGYTQWSEIWLVPGVAATENSRFTSAPAPAGQPAPIPGEQMSYWCGNTNVAVSSPPILGRICYRSFDGGANWEQGAILLTAGVPRHPECGSNAESFGALDGNYPQGGPDGALWVLVQCGGTTYLARSIDEAATFPIIHKADDTPLTLPFSPRELRVDTDGNLYAVEKSGSSLLLRISRDGGETWSDALNMTDPGARQGSVTQWQAAVGAPGQVTVTFLAARASGGLDAYIAVSRDALDANPVFYGATINPPSTPMVSSSPAGDDYIDVDIAPDGTPWAAFYSDCPDESDAFCVATAGQPLPEGNGLVGPQGTTVGRLVWNDNCPFVANPDQLDRGGIDTDVPDGIGDACQCGDVTGNGIVNGQDANAIKRHALAEPNPLFAVPGNCDVTGNGACNGQDANAVKRAALGVEPNPLFGQNCHNAIGAPVPPDL